MRELSLFTGIGGGLLGTVHLLGWRPVGYVEIDDYCQRLLRQRIDDGLLPDAPIFGDIRAFISEGYAKSYSGMVDIITGGFPCQPFSVAGHQRGEDDPRNMWSETIECIRQVRPRYALLENVPGLVSCGYFSKILADIHEAGYSARWDIISAAETGAPHLRKRLWILLSDSNGERQLHPEGNVEKLWRWTGDQGEKISNSSQEHVPVHRGSEQSRSQDMQTGSDSMASNLWWAIDPAELPDTNLSGLQKLERKEEKETIRTQQHNRKSYVPDSDSERIWLGGGEEPIEEQRNNGQRTQEDDCREWWQSQPRLGRVADGIPNRVDRLKAIGNGQVPSVVKAAWSLLRWGY